MRRIPFTTKIDLLNTTEQPQKAREFVLIPDRQVLSRRPSSCLSCAGPRAGERDTSSSESEYRPIFLTSTTGRSADPIPFLFSQHDLDNLALSGKRLFEVCGANREMRMLNLFPYAPHLAFWQAHYGGTAFGVFVASTGGGKVMGTDGNLRFMRKIQPDVLIGMPTFVYHVLHQAVEEGVRCEQSAAHRPRRRKSPDGMRRKLRALGAELGADERRRRRHLRFHRSENGVGRMSVSSRATKRAVIISIPIWACSK